jgi:carboxypeptidase PM20D1
MIGWSIALGIVSALVVLILVVLIRTWIFHSRKKEEKKTEPAEIDKEKAITNLQALVQCKTVSYAKKNLEDEKEFSKLKELLKSLFPQVYAKAEFQELGPRELFFHLLGKSEDKKQASVFMAHFDVVPANGKNWKKDPFAGIIEDGILWGRGTIDTKGTLNGVLSGAESLLEKGFVPEHDMYFAFAGDEETAGGSAKLAVQYFKDHQIEPTLVLDEGGAVINGFFPGVNRPTAVIGTAEKGAYAIEFHIDGEGGHASAPGPHTPVGKLARAAVDIEKHPFKFHLTQPVKEMFNTLGRESTFTYRIIFANLWLFKPLLDKITKKSGGQLNALVRTTIALTQMEGSPATNVIPDSAMIGMNLRLLPNDSIKSVTEKYEKIACKYGVKMVPVQGYKWGASAISTTKSFGYEKIKETILDTWGDETIVTPFLMTAAADARWYGDISDKVYRFSPVKLNHNQMEMIHGDDEQLSKTQIAEEVEFYYRLMKSL